MVRGSGEFRYGSGKVTFDERLLALQQVYQRLQAQTPTIERDPLPSGEFHLSLNLVQNLQKVARKSQVVRGVATFAYPVIGQARSL